MDYMELAVEKTIEGMDNNIGGPFGAAIVRGDEIIVVCSNRNNNNYRLYDKFQMVKIWLLKSTQKAVYSADIVRLKKAIGKLPSGDLQALQTQIESARNALLQRNREQLRGLHSLYRLCTVLQLY